MNACVAHKLGLRSPLTKGTSVMLFMAVASLGAMEWSRQKPTVFVFFFCFAPTKLKRHCTSELTSELDLQRAQSPSQEQRVSMWMTCPRVHDCVG